MREKLRFLALDVHAETIAVAVADPDGEVRSLGTIANREDSIRKFIKKLGSPEQLRACYEAGPTGFVLYWQLAQLGVECAVVAPSLVPKKPGDRVKTDRRDALKLARSHRSGDLTAVWVPDEDSEALRDLVRQREAAKQDQLRARHRLTKFLLRTGRRPPLGLKPWTERYMRWLAQIRYTQPAPAAAGASTKENPRLPYATGSTGLAITVRGSSRRIMIMRFRPANIRLINRRQFCPGCCSLCPRGEATTITKTNPSIQRS